jgi:ATP/maltotriose-dependent transcriptional regulator MalT
VTNEEVGILLQITEGWVTGLILLKDRMPNKTSSMKDPRGIGLPGSDHPLADYFFHEIFHRLEPALQTFMIRSSLLESFSISSVAALIADDPRDVAAHVRSLVRRHLLSEIPVSKEPLFQYHALLREFLRDRLKELPQDEQQACVDRAAEVLEREGQWDLAVDLFVFRQDFDRAATLIEKFGMGHVYQGRRQRLLEWVQALPLNYPNDRPWLRFFLGAGREFQQPLNALNDYRTALEQFRRAGDVEGEAWAVSSLVFLCFQLGQDLRMMKKYAVWARKAVKTHHAISPAARAFSLFVDGLATCSADADLPRGLKRLLASARLSHENGFSFLYVSAMSFAGEVSGFSKASRNAAVYFGKAEQAISHEKFDPVLRTQLLMLRGTVHVMRSAYEEGVKDLIEGERVSLDYGLIPFLDPIQTHLAHARLRLGDPCAWDALESIHQRISSSSPNRGHEAYIFFIKAFHFLENGDFPRALAQVNESIRLLNECGYFLPLRLANTLAGAIFREMGDLRQAEQYLLFALSEMAKGGHQLWTFAALLELAKLYIDCGKEARAKRYLTRALRIGKEEGYRATSVLTDQTKCVLIRHALQWNLEPGYVRTLQTYWKVPTPLPLKIHTLGRFEVFLQDRPVPGQAWHGRKARDLLLVLLSLGGKEVSKEKVGDLLWPDAEGDRAITNFHTTLHRLRSALGCPPNSRNGLFVDLAAGHLSLNPTQCWSDCCAFEEEIRQAQQAETQAQWDKARFHLERARDLYQGEYLPGFERPWIVSRRQDLHRRWLWAEQRLNSFSPSAL